MSIVTIRPNATVVNSMTLTGPSAHSATSDSSDSTYISAPYGQFSQAVLDLANYSIPSNQFLKQVRVRIRYRTYNDMGFGVITYWVARFITSSGYYGASQSFSSVSSSPVEAVGGWQTKAPSGAGWTQAELDALQVDIYPGYYTGNVQMPRVYEVYVDLDLNSSPSTATTSPAKNGTVTNTTRPPLLFTYSDPDGDAMEGYRAKLFSSAQYSASGFDPNTSPSLYDTGKVGAYGPPPSGVTAPIDLLNLQTYRWYVWVYQTGGPPGTAGFGVSAPDYTQFSINVTPPAIPTITATAYSSPFFLVNVNVAVGSGGAATNSIVVERSSDGGTTWRETRESPVFITSGNTNFYDMEVIPNRNVIYRARALTSSGIASVWSGFTPFVTIIDNEWRLSDVTDWNARMPLSVIGDSIAQRSPEDKAFFKPLGRKRKVSVSDVISGEESQMTIEFLTEADYLKFESLRNSQRTLWLTRGWTGEGWYIQFEQVREMTLHNYSPTYRTVTISWIEVDAP